MKLSLMTLRSILWLLVCSAAGAQAPLSIVEVALDTGAVGQEIVVSGERIVISTALMPLARPAVLKEVSFYYESINAGAGVSNLDPVTIVFAGGRQVASGQTTHIEDYRELCRMEYQPCTADQGTFVSVPVTQSLYVEDEPVLVGIVVDDTLPAASRLRLRGDDSVSAPSVYYHVDPLDPVPSISSASDIDGNSEFDICQGFQADGAALGWGQPLIRASFRVNDRGSSLVGSHWGPRIPVYCETSNPEIQLTIVPTRTTVEIAEPIILLAELKVAEQIQGDNAGVINAKELSGESEFRMELSLDGRFFKAKGGGVDCGEDSRLVLTAGLELKGRFDFLFNGAERQWYEGSVYLRVVHESTGVISNTVVVQRTRDPLVSDELRTAFTGEVLGDVVRGYSGLRLYPNIVSDWRTRIAQNANGAYGDWMRMGLGSALLKEGGRGTPGQLSPAVESMVEEGRDLLAAISPGFPLELAAKLYRAEAEYLLGNTALACSIAADLLTEPDLSVEKPWVEALLSRCP